MGAYPLFESRRNVSVEEIRLALAGNLCRCNAYGAIIDSVVGAIGIKADG
jgi:aerobic-type carbon monoxide dehydrogenase small subunit (CoxS/CutS family)